MLVACDFLMDTDGNGIWVHLNMQWECVCDFSRGSLQHTLGHGGNRRDHRFAFKRDTCGVVVTHATFLCIPLACFDASNLLTLFDEMRLLVVILGHSPC